MASRGTHVRVMPETLAQLRQLVEQMDPSGRAGTKTPFWGRGRLTTAALIAELVRRELAHRERSRRTARAGRQRAPRKAPEAPEDASDPDRAIWAFVGRACFYWAVRAASAAWGIVRRWF